MAPNSDYKYFITNTNATNYIFQDFLEKKAVEPDKAVDPPYLSFHEYLSMHKDKKPNVERTFVMLKPDSFERGLVGEIMDLLDRRGLRLIACKLLTMTPEQCQKHYSHHVGKNFWPELQDFMTGGPSLALVYEGENACMSVRQLIGQKHPSQSPPGSIRGRYAMEFPRNLIHGSDGPEDAAREMSLYFTKEEIYDFNRVALLKEQEAVAKVKKENEKKAKLAKGISLGDEVFSPYLLQVGDIIVDPDDDSGIQPMAYEVVSVEKNDDNVAITANLYGGGMMLGHNVNVMITNDDAWEAGFISDFPRLIQREGHQVDGFTLPDMINAQGKMVHYKDGKWLPKFTKKTALGLNQSKYIDLFIKSEPIPGYMHKFRLVNPAGHDITTAYLPGGKMSSTTADLRLREVAKTYANEVADYGKPFALYFDGGLWRVSDGNKTWKP